MGTWARTGPVVVEVDGSSEGLRVVDYACTEALRTGAELVLVASYHPHACFSPTTPGYRSRPPAEVAQEDLRVAVAQVRRQVGDALPVSSLAVDGARLRVLPEAARHARMLVVGRTRTRGPHRLVTAQADLNLAARTGCPVVVVPMSWKPSAADRSVAVGIDGTTLSLEAVEFAFRTAADRGGELTVVHAQHAPRHLPADTPAQESWVRRADLTVAETLAGWTEEYADVKVTRFLTGRPVVAALVHEGQEAGLVVLGSHAHAVPITDPVARRAIASMPCPVAIVPHHPSDAERQQRRRQLGDEVRAADLAVPTS